MKRIIGSLATLALCAPLLASAAEGWVVADISLQAGPDTEYPSIVELRAGTPVSIQGCIQGWTWCDVVAGPDRGWVPGTFLEEDYGGQRVVVIDYGPRIGIPVVAFSLGVYWDSHYHNRPFYAQRQEWSSRSIAPHAPPRPTGAAATATRQAPATTTRDQQRMPPATTATTSTTAPTDRARTSPAQTVEPDRRTGSANTEHREPKSERAPAPTPQPESRPTTPSDAAPQIKQPAEPPKAAPAPRTAMQQRPKDEQKPRSNEPKPKDELKAPPKKNEGDKKKDDDSGGGGR
jgi:uncharacterized protein YraI